MSFENAPFDLFSILGSLWERHTDIKTVVQILKDNQGSNYRIRKLKETKEKRYLVFYPNGHHYVLRLTHLNGYYTGSIASDSYMFLSDEEVEQHRKKIKAF